ncbi:MAG: glucose PTS transporter subunit IIA [Lachnospiraceae bacterium]
MAYKYEATVNGIMECIGGVRNIANATHCATRFRLRLKDMDKLDEEGLQNVKGVLGLRKMDNNEIQIICGTVVSTIYDEFQQITGFKGAGAVNDPAAAREDGVKKKLTVKKAAGIVTEYLGGTVAPVIPIYLACGLLLAVLSVCTQFFGLSEDSGTYIILNACSLGGLTFMPIALGWSACQKLGADPALGAMLGMTILYGTVNGVGGLDFLGIPVYQTAGYNGSFLPIVLAAPFLAMVYKFFRDRIPESIRYFALPLITMLISVPVTLIVIGPIGYICGTGLSVVFTWLGEHVKLLAITIWGFTTPLGIITGFDKAIYALNMEHLNAVGFDNLFLPGGLAGNSAIGGAALAAMFLSKNKDVRSTGGSAGVTAIIGITEPALYGICLRFRTPLIGAMSGAAVGSFFAGLVNLKQYVYAGPGLSTCVTYLSNKEGGYFNFIMCFATIAVSAIAGFVITYVLSKHNKTQYGEDSTVKTIDRQADFPFTIGAPAKGEVVPMEQIQDETFAAGTVGPCIGIDPTQGKVYAPCNGTITHVADSLHAIGITADNGMEILIHVGIDTVNMNGNGFSSKVKIGQKVTRGEALMKMDLEKIHNAGYPSTVVTIITNTEDVSVDVVGSGNMNPGQDLMKISK